MNPKDFQSLVKRMQSTFDAAASERKRRPNLVPDPDDLGSTELEWVLYERVIMFNAVNQERAKLSLPPVAMPEFRRVETTATGHCDYGTKFPLYCAELAIGMKILE